jgi:hypothetical protein
MAVGVLLIILGLVFLAFTQNLFGLQWSDVGDFWPVFPIIGGLFVLVPALAATSSHARGAMVFAGAIPVLVGLFFFSITLGVFSWGDLSFLWPVYPLIVGVAFLAGYAASGFKHTYYLIPGLVVSAVALVLFAMTATGSYDLLGKLWPVFLIIAGLLMLIPRTRRITS